MATKQKFVCPKCKAKLKLDSEKNISAGTKFKCPGCASVLRYGKPGLPQGILSLPTTSQPAPRAGINQEDPGEETQDLARRLDIARGFARADEADKEVPAALSHPPGAKDGPLIPEDRLDAPKPPGETLLEEFTPKKLGEFEEGEPEEGDPEWARFVDKSGKHLAESKIDMNELPPALSFLKETLIRLRQAEEFNLKGEILISKKLYTQALKDLSWALEINPDYVDALVNRGSAYAELGRFNEALMDYNHALKFEKDDAEIYNRRGEIYLHNKMYDQAIKDFTAALILRPIYSFAYLNRGRAYSEKGMQQEAMTDFKQALRSDFDPASPSFVGQPSPGDYSDEENTGYEQKAAAFKEQGLADLKNEKYEAALENFTRAIKFSARDAEVYSCRGQAYMKLFQPDSAMNDFNQAVLLDPLNPSLYFWRAQAWRAKDDLANMTDDLKISCELGYEPACLAYSRSRTKKQ